MKSFKEKSQRNSYKVGFIFFIILITIGFLKGFLWDHPSLLIIVFLWTITIMWLVFRLSKKYYANKELYLPPTLELGSKKYLDRKQEWKQFVLQKVFKYTRYFALANIVMCTMNAIEYYDDGSSSIHQIKFFGFFAVLSIIAVIFLKIRLNKMERQNQSHLTDLQIEVINQMFQNEITNVLKQTLF